MTLVPTCFDGLPEGHTKYSLAMQEPSTPSMSAAISMQQALWTCTRCGSERVLPRCFAVAISNQVTSLRRSGQKYKQSARHSAGAEKWLHVQMWTSAADCLAAAKASGYQVGLILPDIDASQDPRL